MRTPLILDRIIDFPIRSKSAIPCPTSFPPHPSLFFMNDQSIAFVSVFMTNIESFFDLLIFENSIMVIKSSYLLS
ncbi:hypothetical protein AR158_c135R [Paramecium bursaria Chlorella virus AR158]|uniref:hypothetical protein n=1 Tax=Paramecium bursaria Chlorella virus AR158 TaxID=380598 RepID=UPI00015AA7E6|nr:hypothetical protein AR158_c135R [Paramecium bursaria Chlorella virus AR158]ABU43681.1 hypothetical protein AR158_c135R [Paramecium bursaria Chlorella virus AR158]